MNRPLLFFFLLISASSLVAQSHHAGSSPAKAPNEGRVSSAVSTAWSASKHLSNGYRFSLKVLMSGLWKGESPWIPYSLQRGFDQDFDFENFGPFGYLLAAKSVQTASIIAKTEWQSWHFENEEPWNFFATTDQRIQWNLKRIEKPLGFESLKLDYHTPSGHNALLVFASGGFRCLASGYKSSDVVQFNKNSQCTFPGSFGVEEQEPDKIAVQSENLFRKILNGTAAQCWSQRRYDKPFLALFTASNPAVMCGFLNLPIDDRYPRARRFNQLTCGNSVQQELYTLRGTGEAIAIASGPDSLTVLEPAATPERRTQVVFEEGIRVTQSSASALTAVSPVERTAAPRLPADIPLAEYRCRNVDSAEEERVVFFDAALAAGRRLPIPESDSIWIMRFKNSEPDIPKRIAWINAAEVWPRLAELPSPLCVWEPQIDLPCALAVLKTVTYIAQDLSVTEVTDAITPAMHHSVAALALDAMLKVAVELPDWLARSQTRIVIEVLLKQLDETTKNGLQASLNSILLNEEIGTSIDAAEVEPLLTLAGLSSTIFLRMESNIK